MPSSGVVQPIPLEQEYGKPNGIGPQDVSKLRQWVRTQPHLPGDYITDLDLILAYHSCECSQAVAKQVLDLHYTLRTLFTTFFKDRVVDHKIEKICNSILITPLESLTKEGYAILYTYFLESDAKNYSAAEAVRCLLMVLDLWQYEEGTWPGYVTVVDLKQMSLGHLSKMDLHTVQHFIYYLQEAMLVRVKAIHFINAPVFMDKFMMILRPFMKKALQEKVHIHQVGSRTLEEYVSTDVLPKDAGGKFKSFQECKDSTMAKLKANKEFFANEAKKRVVESLRPGKPKNISDIFGSVEGSFKKLELD